MGAERKGLPECEVRLAGQGLLVWGRSALAEPPRVKAALRAAQLRERVPRILVSHELRIALESPHLLAREHLVRELADRLHRRLRLQPVAQRAICEARPILS